MRLYYQSEYSLHVQRWRAALELVECSERPARADGFYLWFDGRRLQLYQATDPAGVCLRAEDFSPRVTISGDLAKACGVTGRFKPRVVDAMAGLGVDGMTLAALGCAVTFIERQPSLWALLDDFLWANPRFGGELHRADSVQWLNAQPTPCCDTLYLDPMFPARSKTALPGKAMQYVREVCEVGSFDPEADVPAAQWVDRAIALARMRVVLKRRAKDPVVGQPAWQIKGRTVRYDVYRGGG